jgi:hypothetical protein
MKTKLLKWTMGIFFSLALLISENVCAQTRAYENFQYPVGTDYQQVAGSGEGWAGTWTGKSDGSANVGGGFHQVVAGNLEGTLGESGAMGGQWVDSYRDISTPAINNAGNDLWAAFSAKNYDPSTTIAMTYFSSISGNANENLYIGTLPEDYIGIGNCFQDAACKGPRADAPGITLTSDAAHYYLVHIKFLGNNIIHADLWADYNGLTPPLADISEPTYQNGGYRNAVDGINKIRISGGSQPADATSKYGVYDAIRINSSFFPRYDLKLVGRAFFPLEDPIAIKPVVKSNSSYYPNPVTGGELNVIAKEESLKTVSIIDLSGKKVASQAVSGQKALINTQSLPKGVYILEVVGSKTTSRNKLVIN